MYLLFSNDSLTIEKKLHVEDFRLLRERFNRTTGENFDRPTNNKTAGKNKFFLEF